MEGNVSKFDKTDIIDLDILITKKLDNVFDLAYLLVDLQSTMNTFYYVTYVQVRPRKALPSASRRFSGRFRDALTLKEAISGSFLLNVGATVLGGIILIFIQRLLESRKPSNIHEHHHGPVVNITVNIKGPDQEVIHSVVNEIQLDPDTETSVNNLFERLKESGVAGEYFAYSPEGVKELAKCIDRLGRSLDTYK